MKELIGKLSRGVIEYDLPTVDTSVSEIKKDISEIKDREGAFSVYSEEDVVLKGIVYSSSERVKLYEDKFCGTDNIIKYKVYCDNCDEGSKIIGNFSVVSNGGEVVIPYEFTVCNGTIKSYEGDIEDLFQFTNLVKTKYEEAVKIFKNEKFVQYILKDNIQYQALYEGLAGSQNDNIAIEEFLIGINKKQRVVFSISDTVRKYNSLEKNYGDIIIISKDVWGYAEINVIVEGNFICDCKEIITTEEFAGNNYEYRYTIDISKLHSGMNYGRLKFVTAFQTLECEIVVEGPSKRNLGNLERKLCVASLTEMYLKFRMRKYSVNEWADDSLRAIDRMRGFSDDSNFIKLVQAQIYLSRSMEEQAGWLLGNVAEDILDERETNIELYAYYLYVRTIQKRNPEMTDDVLRKVKHYYENGHDSWKMLWILLYLDNSYENNKSLKIARIKEQYNRGCRSPLMYFEALNAFSRQPALLRVINDFELQVLNFGCKHEGINNRLALQIAEIASTEKRFRPLLFNVLTSLYERVGDIDILTSICSMLIKGNKTDKKYFKWFKLGVEYDIRLAKLYEYYIFTMGNEKEAVFNEKLFMYFINNGEALMDKQEILYVNVINSKMEIPTIYSKYKDNIEKFALQQIEKGNINDNLAIIYEDILKEAMIDNELGQKLVPIINTYKIESFNENVSEVIVIHKEIMGEIRYPIKKGKAYIQMYTEDPAIVFVDKNKNRYSKTINYTIKQVINNKEYMKLLSKMQINDKFLCANMVEELIKYHNDSYKSVDLFKQIINDVEYRKYFKSLIMKDVIAFYYDNYDGDELDEFIRSIDDEYLNNESKVKITELMILRGLNDNLPDRIADIGCENISGRKLAKYCSRKISEYDNEYDEQLVRACLCVFKKGKYNLEILKYLCRHFNGTTKDMIEVWKEAKEFGYSDREFEERIIAQMLFSRMQMGKIVDVYESYCLNGATLEVKNAFLFFEAHDYIVNELPVDDRVFRHLYKEFEDGNELNDICKTAFLKYYSENEADKDILDVCEKLIADLVRKNIMFEFFKKYKDVLTLPSEVLENVIIEYRTRPDTKVYFEYMISENGENEGEFSLSEMQQIFSGVYTKKIMIFYGEKLLYYISEGEEQERSLTESEKFYLDSNMLDSIDTRYSKLNEILVCKELKEDSTLKNLMKEYFMEKKLVDNLFN